MKKMFTEDLNILLSSCGFDGKLCLTGALNIFMDIASLHEEELGCGIVPMEEKGLYWIIGRNRVHFYDRPGLMDRVKVYTWFEKPSKLYGNRYYAICSKDGSLLVSGCTEWLIATEGCKKLIPLKDYVPQAEEYPDIQMFASSEKKLSKSIDGMNLVGVYKVGADSIDYIGHMNNASYGRALTSLLSSKEIAERKINEITIFYNHQVLEGSEISVYRKDGAEELLEEGNIEEKECSRFTACLPDGTNIFTARILWGENTKEDLDFKKIVEQQLKEYKE